MASLNQAAPAVLEEPVAPESVERERSRFAAMGEIMDSYCVWSKFGKRPCYWHKTQKAAEKEALRLAAKFPSRKFIVLHAVSKFSVEKQPIEQEAA